MPAAAPARPGGRDGSITPRTSVILLLLFAAAVCAWVLALPLFPTQDGPMHLYFVRVLEALLFGRDPGILGRFYTVKHVLPPYSLYYYLLVALHHVCTLARADQLVICLYVVLFLFGFRSLATALGPEGNSVALLAAPLVLSWPLGMGFVNFCLSLSLALWAMGLWCRAAQSTVADGKRLAGFVLLCYLMLLTHPVPLLVTLAFTLAELLLRLISHIRRGVQAPYLGTAALAWALAALSVGYLLLFKGAHSMVQHHDYASYHAMVAGNAKNFYLLRTLTLFAGHSAADTLYKAAILLLPPDLNNSHLFTARLVVLVWLALLAGASATRLRLPAWLLPAAGGALAAWTLAFSIVRVTPVAHEIARFEREPTGLDHNVALFLHSQDYFKTDRLSYDPYFWSPVRLLRRSGSVMLNTPWLDLQIIPIGAQPRMPTGRIDSYALESPADLRRDLEGSAQDRLLLGAQLDAVLVNEGPRPPATDATTDAMLPALTSNPANWQCTPHALTEVCLPRP